MNKENTQALAAGFVFDRWSDLHYRPDDELRYEVGRRRVTGSTDRFTLRFRRPEWNDGAVSAEKTQPSKTSAHSRNARE